VARYDALGLEFQIRTGRLQLEGVDLQGKEVLDVGCGTGALSFIALEKGAASVTCGDISSQMLRVAQEKAAAAEFGADRIRFRELDAELLPFPPACFDVAMTGMMFAEAARACAAPLLQHYLVRDPGSRPKTACNHGDRNSAGPSAPNPTAGRGTRRAPPQSRRSPRLRPPGPA
jgi:SAM-dependent methyltransferase